VKKRLSHPALHIAFLLCGLMMAGCGVEVENPDNPTPISPKVPANGEKSSTAPQTPDGGDRSTSGPASSSAPAQNVPLPTVTCSVTLTRSESGGSNKDGAVFEFPATDEYAAASLLYRTQSTASFIEVRDQVFSSGTFASGSYVFEYYKGDGSSCLVPVTVTADYVANRVKLTLGLALPQ